MPAQMTHCSSIIRVILPFLSLIKIGIADKSTGHGGQTKDLDADKETGYDEVIYPVDFRVTGHIVDDDMHTIMVKPLQAGVRLTAIFDSCHSATALDLPYIYSTSGILREPNFAKEAGHALLGAISSYKKGNFSKGSSNMKSFFKKALLVMVLMQRTTKQ
jgi:metacaspase-1